jgi:hypothetical protein
MDFKRFLIYCYVPRKQIRQILNLVEFVQKFLKSKKFKYFLHSMHPSAILRTSRTDKVWDKQVNELLDNPESINRISEYSIIINGYHIWTSNYPYAYGNQSGRDKLPRRSTVARLKMFVDAYDAKIKRERRGY